MSVLLTIMLCILLGSNPDGKATQMTVIINIQNRKILHKTCLFENSSLIILFHPTIESKIMPI